MPTTVSAAGVKFTAGFEGCKLTAYPDPASGGDPWTIGYGETGAHVVPGLTITQEQAEEWLQLSLAAAAKSVLSLVKIALTQNELDSLSDLTFNIGANNLAGSTLLRMLNAGFHEDAANQFNRWVFADGKIMPGLVVRRKAERALFLKPDNTGA